MPDPTIEQLLEKIEACEKTNTEQEELIKALQSKLDKVVELNQALLNKRVESANQDKDSVASQKLEKYLKGE